MSKGQEQVDKGGAETKSGSGGSKPFGIDFSEVMKSATIQYTEGANPDFTKDIAAFEDNSSSTDGLQDYRSGLMADSGAKGEKPSSGADSQLALSGQLKGTLPALELEFPKEQAGNGQVPEKAEISTKESSKDIVEAKEAPQLKEVASIAEAVEQPKSSRRDLVASLENVGRVSNSARSHLTQLSERLPA